jgi:hypothetical protein
MNKELEGKIEKLWAWFQREEQVIRECVEDELAPRRDEIVEELNNLVLDFGLFSWEIRPGVFTISPNGDADRFKISRQIMSEAPLQLQWELHYAKPAKDWDPAMFIYNMNMDEEYIDLSNWSYSAEKDSTGKFELRLLTDNISHLDPDTCESVIQEVVQSFLGEENCIRFVHSVKLVESLSAQSSPLDQLPEFGRSLS